MNIVIRDHMIKEDYPLILEHDGIFVARDDLYPGGTKCRVLKRFFSSCVTNTFVYPGTAFGAAIVALAHAAVKSNKKVIVYIAKRKPETFTEFMLEAQNIAPNNLEYRFVEMGFYPNVKRACKKFCGENSMEVIYVSAGVDEPWAVNIISDLAEKIVADYGQFDVVFSACSSGTLQRGLQKGGIAKKYVGVGTGQKNPNKGIAELIEHYNIQKFEQKAKDLPPFPTVPNYDGKVWSYVKNYKLEHPNERVLMWNVYATKSDRERCLTLL